MLKNETDMDAAMDAVSRFILDSETLREKGVVAFAHLPWMDRLYLCTVLHNLCRLFRA